MEDIQKIYWTPSQAAKLLTTKTRKVKTCTIRFWETEFKDWIKPKRDKRNQRLYRKHDIEILLTIRNLLYFEKFTIQGAREKMAVFSIEDSGIWPRDTINYKPGDVINVQGRQCKIR